MVEGLTSSCPAIWSTVENATRSGWSTMYSAIRFCDWVSLSYWRRSSSTTVSALGGLKPALFSMVLVDKPVTLPLGPLRDMRQDAVGEPGQQIFHLFAIPRERPQHRFLAAGGLER